MESSDISAGRRIVTHQYPQRDEPFTEDLGRAAREYEISAFVLGDDCVDQAYAVRDAIEQPGPGTLVHPEFGEVQVIARPGGSMSFSQTRRIVHFTLTFVEAGLNAFPEMGQATQSQSRAAADGLMSSACDAFAEAIDLEAVEDFVKDTLNGDLLDSLGIISNSEIAEVLGFADRVSDLANSAIDLVSTDPRAFATQLMGACGLSGLATTVAGWQRVGTSLCSLVDDLHGADDEPIYSQVKPHSAEVIETNREAVYALARSAILVQAVGVSTLIGTDIDSTVSTSSILPDDDEAAIAEIDYEDDSSSSEPTVSYDEMQASQARIVGTLDEEMLDTTSDSVFTALRNAATAVSRDLSDRSRTAARLSEYDAGAVLPACVTAMELYGDAARAKEIVVRNAVKHPLFCPNVLKVLNE